MPPSGQNALLEKMVDLTTELAITNKTLASVGQEVQIHNKLIYGDETGNGGILFQVKTDAKDIQSHNEILTRLEASCGKVVTFMETQMTINKSQSDTIHNLNRIVLGLAGVVILILILIGVADIKSLGEILSTIHF